MDKNGPFIFFLIRHKDPYTGPFSNRHLYFQPYLGTHISNNSNGSALFQYVTGLLKTEQFKRKNIY